MPLPRLSGILLHPTSLPGPYGAGDLGAAARHFVDWLVVGRQSLWQMLPVGDIGTGHSPYMSPSAFAGNVLLLDLVQLREAGWLDDRDLIAEPGFDPHHVDYDAMISFRMVRLRKAAARFFAARSNKTGDAGHTTFDAFCAVERDWLDDYALFKALEQACGEDMAWQDWPRPLALREQAAMRDAAAVHANEIAFWKFCQWQFAAQWQHLKTYANARGVDIIGDVPIFVALQSADVWAHPHLFDLDDKGQPRVVAGVPPDKFSDTGQRWGNPLYRWHAHTVDGYGWWVARMRRALALFDRVRIDHFRGFEACWEIPADDETALGGRWVPGPGEAMFKAIKKELGALPFIAEDLGVITPAVDALRTAFGLSGMRILQFAFDGDPDNTYLPHNFKADAVVYTGTHDNDTTRGWWATLPERDRDQARRYLGVNGDWIHWDLIRAAWSSVAEFAIAPMQDVLGLDSSHRMNRPGEADGSWIWRFGWHQVTAWHAQHLAEWTELYGRQRQPASPVSVPQRPA